MLRTFAERDVEQASRQIDEGMRYEFHTHTHTHSLAHTHTHVVYICRKECRSKLQGNCWDICHVIHTVPVYTHVSYLYVYVRIYILFVRVLLHGSCLCAIHVSYLYAYVHIHHLYVHVHIHPGTEIYSFHVHAYAYMHSYIHTYIHTYSSKSE
jgi:hypothetical protein